MEPPMLPFTTEEIIAMVNSTDPEERKVGIRRIWTDYPHLQDKEKLDALGPILHQLLKDTGLIDREIWHVMLALGTIEFIDAIPDIYRLLQESSDENVRGFGVDALGRMGSKNLQRSIKEYLWKLSRTDDSLVVRVNSIRALSTDMFGSKDRDLSLQLYDLLKEQSHSAIQTAIIDCIGEIGSVQIAPEMLNIMIARRVESEQQSAARALDRIAAINGYADRKELIQSIGADTYESA